MTAQGYAGFFAYFGSEFVEIARIFSQFRLAAINQSSLGRVVAIDHP